MSALPASQYGDPEQILSGQEAKAIYREKGCKACVSFDPERRGIQCRKGIDANPLWCEGFEEKV